MNYEGLTVYHDLWAMALAKSFETHFRAEGLEPTVALDLRTAALHVCRIAAGILAFNEAELPPPQALAPVVLGRLLDPAGDPVPALRVDRGFSSGFLDLVRAYGAEVVPQAYPAFVLAPDSGVLRLGDDVDVCLVARWRPENGHHTNLAILAPHGRTSSAAVTWRRSGDDLRIRLDRPAPALKALDPYRIGHGRVGPLLDRVARSRETTIERLEKMLRVGQRLHAAMPRIGYLTPVPLVSASADLEKAIDEIEAGKTLGYVDVASGR